MCSALPSTAPPQLIQSTRHWPFAAARFASRAATVVVSGRQFSGMSIKVVKPPAAAARVPVAKPSQSVRPGSFRCTWVSTRPGRIASSPGIVQHYLTRHFRNAADGLDNAVVHEDGRGMFALGCHNAL